MFTLEEINNEIPIFNKYMNYTEIPFIDNFIYMEESNFNPNAKVDIKDLATNKYIIYLNKRLDEFPIKYQLSVIWHEFTHIFDFITYKNKYKNIHELLKSYSESHAIAIQLKYLSDLKSNDKITNPDIKIYYQDKMQSYGQISADYFNKSLSYMLEYVDTKNLIAFHNALNYFFYFCGYLSIRSNSQVLFDHAMKKYPNNDYKKTLILLGNSILNRNIQLVIKIYKDICLKEINLN